MKMLAYALLLSVCTSACMSSTRKMPPSCVKLHGPWPDGTWWVCEEHDEDASNE
jgi:hypothetical protein